MFGWMVGFVRSSGVWRLFVTGLLGFGEPRAICVVALGTCPSGKLLRVDLLTKFVYCSETSVVSAGTEYSACGPLETLNHFCMAIVTHAQCSLRLLFCQISFVS